MAWHELRRGQAGSVWGVRVARSDKPWHFAGHRPRPASSLDLQHRTGLFEVRVWFKVMTRLLCPGLIDLGVYRRPRLSLALLCGTWSALEHSVNDRRIHLDVSYRMPREWNSEWGRRDARSHDAGMLQFGQQGRSPSHALTLSFSVISLPSDSTVIQNLWRNSPIWSKKNGKEKNPTADLNSDTHAPHRLGVLVWESAWVSSKCEQWEEKNVWSCFSCLKHTTEPFWRLTSRRITAPKRCTVYLVSMLQEAAAIYCMYTAEVVSDTPMSPSRTVQCNLCALAPTEPHWQAEFSLCASLNVVFMK